MVHPAGVVTSSLRSAIRALSSAEVTIVSNFEAALHYADMRDFSYIFFEAKPDSIEAAEFARFTIEKNPTCILLALFDPAFADKFFELLQIGVHSTLVVALIGVFTGAILAVQGEYTLAQFGATAFTGSAVALSLIRELGPVLTALMVIGRAGSAITAEIWICNSNDELN